MNQAPVKKEESEELDPQLLYLKDSSFVLKSYLNTKYKFAFRYFHLIILILVRKLFKWWKPMESIFVKYLSIRYIETERLLLRPVT